MSASKAIKEIGLPSLRFVSVKINRPPNLLQQWYKNYPELFNSVIHGVKALDELKQVNTK